ncbi:YtxH domain-containing protein [Peptostreptococcaceae bacterium OttesenSCG-928-C18]|nr:YtxH domain-containing protein [Peptostreptococcaceae bacterium OttesenSCG-928-C18]
MSLLDYLEAKKREKERQLKWEMKKKQLDTAGKIALGTVAGTLAGITAGVLFAPKSGEETRQDIKEFASDASESVKENLSTMKDTVIYKTEEIVGDIKDKYDEFKERGVTELEKASDEVEDVKEKAEKVKKTVKNAAEEIKDEVK